MDEPIRVLVIDDHSIVRRGMIEIVRDIFPSVTVDEAADGEQALQKCLTGDWDIVLLDITLPVLNDIEIIRQIKLQRRDLHVIMLSMHSRSAYVIRAFELGALGYLGKDAASDELEPAIRSVLNGDKYVGRDISMR
jgi:DNA-binding NarL/FixJ family response regulator